MRLVTKEDFVLCKIPVGPASELAIAVGQLKGDTTSGLSTFSGGTLELEQMKAGTVCVANTHISRNRKT